MHNNTSLCACFYMYIISMTDHFPNPFIIFRYVTPAALFAHRGHTLVGASPVRGGVCGDKDGRSLCSQRNWSCLNHQRFVMK